MVTENLWPFSALTRYRLGTVLIWAGVLTWTPFILLRAVGYRPSFLWFLPFHLLGVLGGSRLRATARGELGIEPPKRNWLRRVGHALIFVGVLVWLPYLYMRVIAHKPVEVTQFLPFHLAGIFSGLTLLVLGAAIQAQRKTP